VLTLGLSRAPDVRPTGGGEAPTPQATTNRGSTNENARPIERIAKSFLTNQVLGHLPLPG
jgi:hypothetical protein